MRIGINGRFLVANKTGVQRAAYNLIKTLVSIDRDNEYFLFTSKKELGKPEWDYDNVTIVASGITEGTSLLNLIWEQFTLPRLAKTHNVDILHSPANMAPVFYRGKSIIHIHDVCFVVNPQWYSFLFRTWYNFVIPRLARKADKVVTNSNNSRNDLLQFCKIPIEKISLVYWAVDEAFLSHSTPVPLQEREDYILYVGSLEPRKNIRVLLKAFESMRSTHPRLKTRLVLIGRESKLFAKLGIDFRKFKQDIVVEGFVDDDRLREYYRKAKLVAYPSLYEGFGLPPLEAMASGTPVVTSKTSSLPEVVGDAALKVNPYDIRGLSEAMYSLLEDVDKRSALIAEGYKQVSRFNWYRVVRNMLSIYYEVKHINQEGKSCEESFIPYSKWLTLTKIEEQKIAQLF